MAEKMSPSPGGAITPLQQMLASGTGAILTSLFGEDRGEQVGVGGWHGAMWLKDCVVLVTPLDVVKIRLQAQRTPFSKGSAAQGWAGVSAHPTPVSQHAAYPDLSVSRAAEGDLSAPECGAITRWRVTLTGLGAPLGEPSWCLAPSFPLRSHVLMQPGSALTARSYPCRFVSISTLLPLAPTGQERPCGICPPTCPLPVGTVGWGWSQDTVLVTTWTAWAVAAGASSDFTHRALPLPGLELQDARVPQPGEVACPRVITQHVPIVCFSVAGTVCALGCSAGHM